MGNACGTGLEYKLIDMTEWSSVLHAAINKVNYPPFLNNSFSNFNVVLHVL